MNYVSLLQKQMAHSVNRAAADLGAALSWWAGPRMCSTHTTRQGHWQQQRVGCRERVAALAATPNTRVRALQVQHKQWLVQELHAGPGQAGRIQLACLETLKAASTHFRHSIGQLRAWGVSQQATCSTFVCAGWASTTANMHSHAVLC